MYFINEIVEDLLRRYIWTGCTNVQLRDAIMDHATELIRQIIRKQGLHTIYPGQDESSFGDLLQTAWIQIERTLYKFRARPHCRKCFSPERPNDSLLYKPGELEYGIITYAGMAARGIRKCPKCNTPIVAVPEVEANQDTYGGSESVIFRGNSKVFNMWSQIARTVILAHIKKEGRDRKNSSLYRDHAIRKLKHVDPADGVTPPDGDAVSSQDLDREIRSAIGPHRDIMNPEASRLSSVMLRFLAEAREICKYDDDHLKILDALEHLMKVDDKPAEGMISKLVDHSGLSRVTVTQFMKNIRLRSLDFSDSPIARADESRKFDRRRACGGTDDED